MKATVLTVRCGVGSGWQRRVRIEHALPGGCGYHRGCLRVIRIEELELQECMGEPCRQAPGRYGGGGTPCPDYHYARDIHDTEYCFDCAHDHQCHPRKEAP